MPDLPNHSGPNFETEEPRVTTVETSEWKAKVEPYAAAPVVDVAPGVIGCTFCGNTRFRRSRVRFHDLRELMLLRFPMRCMRCNQRQHGYFLTAGMALAPKSQGARVARGKETWQAWTGNDRQEPSLQRPMSTSMGPRATKLQRPIRRASQNTPPPRGEEDRHIW